MSAPKTEFRLNSELVSSASKWLRSDVEAIKCAQALRGKEKGSAFQKYAEPKATNWKGKATVFADWAMAMWIAGNIATGLVADPSRLAMTAALIPPAFFFADFLGASFHKFLDSFASENSKVWGAIARSFRKHHEVPSNLNDLDYLTHTTPLAKLTAPFFIGASLTSWDPAYGTAVWIVLVSLLNTNEFHKQAHRTTPTPLFRMLQKLRLAISHKEHMAHHGPPFDEHYEVINGWSRRVTEGADLWNRLDMIFWKVFRRLPKHWIQDPRAIPESVIQELTIDLTEVPEDLWTYAEAYPKRVPDHIRELIEQSMKLKASENPSN